ncbi:hypothetical protein AX16_000073 [Volvariella volvacea WC 439]|nr:hypothetical protein AX16_000073 [Volvariella volvacea WC 439]
MIKLHQVNIHHIHHVPRQTLPPVLSGIDTDIESPTTTTTTTTTTSRHTETTPTSTSTSTSTTTSTRTTTSQTTTTSTSTSTSTTTSTTSTTTSTTSSTTTPESPTSSPTPTPEPSRQPTPTPTPHWDPTPSDIIDSISRTSASSRGPSYATQTVTQDGAPTAAVTSESDDGGSGFDSSSLSGVLYALIAIVGVVAIVSVATMAIRRSRRRRDVEDALSFDPSALDNSSQMGLDVPGSNRFGEKSSASFPGSRRVSEVPSLHGSQDAMLRSHSRQGYYPEPYEPYSPSYSPHFHHGHTGSISGQSQIMGYTPPGAAPPYPGEYAHPGHPGQDQQYWPQRT